MAAGRSDVSTTNLGPFERVREIKPEAPFPTLLPVRQSYDISVEEDVVAATRRELEPLRGRITAGARIAVTAGSRGIHDAATVVGAACDWLKELGAQPFVVPAMGSHGGATAEGQLAVLASYGITEQALGVPVLATMETVVLDRLPNGPEVHLDKNANEADGILLVNRIKLHTDFHGEIESGLAKIAAIGLGKQKGAEGIHAYGSAALAEWLPAVAKRIIDTGKVLGGLAILENAHEHTAKIAYVPAEGIGGPAETALLREAGELLGRLPFDQLDVLCIDEMGKDKSGAGMDTNVIGRMWVPGAGEPESPSITCVTVHAISKASYGNAAGIGLADYVPFRVLEEIDMYALYVNSLTSGTGGIRRTKLPMALPTDRATIAAAVLMCGRPDPENVRLVRMRDTLDTVNLLVAESMRAEVEAHPNLSIVGDPVKPTWSDGGALPAWPDELAPI